MTNWKHAIATLALAAGLVSAAPSIGQEAKVLDPLGGMAAAAKMLEGPSDFEKALAAQGWVNQSGSVMNFTYHADGSITGTYVNNAAGTGCQGTAYPLVGFINGNNIAWSVLWSNATANCNSVTAWGGYYDPPSASILTNWVLAYTCGSGGATQLGKDQFKYQ